MTTPVENVAITLDYLKGKRRAEKALGFITDLGSALLSCETEEQVARQTAEYLIRLNLDLAVISYQPLAGNPVTATALAPDLASVVPEAADIVKHCQRQARQLAQAGVRQLDRADATFDAAGSRVVIQQFTFDYRNVGSGFLSVARIRATAPDFTPTELALLHHVMTQFICCVRCLEEDNHGRQPYGTATRVDPER